VICFDADNWGWQRMANGVATKGRILIVDDIPDTVDLVRDWLETYGFSAIGVTSSLKALELAESESPDLILLDVMMPKMDGMETCRRLKANPKTAEIPIIMVTAKNPSEARAEGIMAGAVDYITKPINLQDLVKRIENALANTAHAPVDVQRLLEEVAHSALSILSCDLIWLLGLDNEEEMLQSRILATTGGARAETEFLLTAANGQAMPKFALSDIENPFVSTLLTRKMQVNILADTLKERLTTISVYKATEMLRLSYLSIVPLTAAGRAPGVMVLGSLQPHNMETPRARQIITSLGMQAAIALDYSRLITDLTSRENEMQREQSFREMILDTMSDGLVVIDSKGMVKYTNRRLLRLTDYPRGFLDNRSVGELFHPDDRADVMLGLLREGATTMRFDQRLVTRDGRVIPVWLSRSRSQVSELNNQVIVLSDMTEQKKREAELERQTSRLLALNEAAHVITADLTLHDTLRNILSAALNVVQAQGASLFLFNKDNAQELIVVAAAGTGADVMQGMRVPVGEGVAGWVAREASPQLVGDIRDDPRFYRKVDDQTGFNTQSLIAVPLINADQVIGVVEVVNKLDGELFDQDDVRLLESMAGTAAVSIVNARLFDETQRRVKELGTLLNASAAASSTLQFSQVLESIARNLASGLQVERCIIMSWNASKERLESLADVSDAIWTMAEAPRRSLSREPLLRNVLHTGNVEFVSLLQKNLSNAQRAVLRATGMVHVAVVPVLEGGAISGLMTLGSTHPRAGYMARDAETIHKLLTEWQSAWPGNRMLATADAGALADLSDRMMKVGSTCWVTVQAWDAQADASALLCERGFAEWTKRPGKSLPIQNFPTLQSVVRGRELRMATLEDLSGDPVEQDWLSYHGGQACLLIPLLERGVETVGLVKLLSQEMRLFDEGEVRLAQGIANVASSAVENARLYQTLESRARALESAYNELREADKAKDEFIQNVSHELRTPLISVLGYGALLAEGDFGTINDEQHEALDIIMQKSQKLADIVEDIVSMQALETRTYERQQGDMKAILQAVLDKNQSRAAAAGLQFNAHLDNGLPPVYVDEKTIADAFEKILDNAIKFGGQGKLIDITAQDTDGPVVQVMVRDYGIGIEPSEHHKIFQRFYQVDGGVNRRYSGTGLGLAIVKAVIEGHGGRIGVKSKLGEGATFVFTVPKYSTLVQG